MTEREGGENLFHNRGPMRFQMVRTDFTASTSKIFHLGYLLLLDAIDAEDPEFEPEERSATQALVCRFKTGIDVVRRQRSVFQNHRAGPQASGLLHPQ